MNMPPQSRSDGDLSFDELRAMYDAQCACTDEWVAKYEAEKEKKASANLLNRIAELKSQLADVNQRLAAANEQLTARSENRTQEALRACLTAMTNELNGTGRWVGGGPGSKYRDAMRAAEEALK